MKVLEEINKATKKCPFCAEEIPEEAVYCQFCGSDLEKKKKNKKLFLNEGQETCLWIGVGIIDLFGGIALYNSISKWSSLDVLSFVFLVAITTLSLMYSLQDRPNRPKWQMWLIKHFKNIFS